MLNTATALCALRKKMVLLLPPLAPHRPLSQFTKSEIASAKNWVEHYLGSNVPQHHFNISYSRASGPGGQKVNKTSSKASITLNSQQWLDPVTCSWIPEPIRIQLRHNKIRYETKSGGILVQSDSSRNRDINTINCFEKLVKEIKAKTFFEAEISELDKQKWNSIAEKANNRRLLDKRLQSEKRKSRSKSFDV